MAVHVSPVASLPIIVIQVALMRSYLQRSHNNHHPTISRHYITIRSLHSTGGVMQKDALIRHARAPAETRRGTTVRKNL
jgi:hypothetical protein